MAGVETCQKNLVVLGAGVIGLTVAYLAADKLPSKIFMTQARDPSDIWWGKLVREFHELDRSEIPEPYKFGVGYYTISVIPQEYIPWLNAELFSHGVSFERRQARSLEDLRSLVGPEGILVNATSLVQAQGLLLVEDTKLYPIRGQAILIKSPKIHEFLAAESDDHSTQGGEATYIIPRPGKRCADTVLLGGTYEAGNWDTSLHMDTAQRIFQRCAQIAPSIKDSRAKILKHLVGLRPEREGGARVEAEIVNFPFSSTHNLLPCDSSDLEGGSMRVVHAYGFGAGGYQASWGAAAEVWASVKDLVKGGGKNATT